MSKAPLRVRPSRPRTGPTPRAAPHTHRQPPTPPPPPNPAPTRVEGEGREVSGGVTPPRGPAPPKRAGFRKAASPEGPHRGNSGVRPLPPLRNHGGGESRFVSPLVEELPRLSIAQQDRTLWCGLLPSLGQPGPPRARRLCRRRHRKAQGECRTARARRRSPNAPPTHPTRPPTTTPRVRVWGRIRNDPGTAVAELPWNHREIRGTERHKVARKPDSPSLSSPSLFPSASLLRQPPTLCTTCGLLLARTLRLQEATLQDFSSRNRLSELPWT